MRLLLATLTLLMLCLFALPVQADDDAFDYAPRVTACVAAAGADAAALNACAGAAWTPCSETDGGATTHGMVMCHAMEAGAWTIEMQRALSRLTAARPETASALDAAQADWQAYRDAECSYRVSRWGEGTGARVVLSGCLARMTADRAIALILYEHEDD